MVTAMHYLLSRNEFSHSYALNKNCGVVVVNVVHLLKCQPIKIQVGTQHSNEPNGAKIKYKCKRDKNELIWKQL